MIIPKCPRCHGVRIISFGFLTCGTCRRKLSPMEIENVYGEL